MGYDQMLGMLWRGSEEGAAAKVRHELLTSIMGAWSDGDPIRALIMVLLMLFATDEVNLSGPRAVRGVGWSDHWSFSTHGFPALMVTDTSVHAIRQARRLMDFCAEDAQDFRAGF